MHLHTYTATPPPNSCTHPPLSCDTKHTPSEEPWYGNDVDGGEFYDSTESEVDVKDVFNDAYYERKRKRDEMENGEDDDDA